MTTEFDSLYYNRQGWPISVEEWAKLQECDDYKRIGWDKIGQYRISTIWMGTNMNFCGGPPIIFETMVFDTEKKISIELTTRTLIVDEDVEMWRYATEEAALAGHDQAIMWAKERAGVDEQPNPN